MDRRVRHLRLRAGSPADVGRVLPVLEDALRCASLPDTGSRLLLVRRLALGRIARDTSAQALARVIEQRVAAVGGQWVEGGTPAAAGAAYVSFPGALEARVQLAVRIARGAPHAEWYWPLAVPELRAADGPGDALRHIAWAIAQWPEARRALPAWVVALVQAGGRARLLAAIDAPLGEALVRQVGLAMPDEAVTPAHWQARPGKGPEARYDDPVSDEPRWLRGLLAAAAPRRPLPRVQPAGRARANDEVNPAAAIPARDHIASEIPTASLREAPTSAPAETPLSHAADPAAPQGAGEAVHAQAATAMARQQAARDVIHRAPRPGPQAAQFAEPAAPQADQAPPAHAPWQSPGNLEAEPTACAGLLFLLPVLARLGLAQWLGETHHDTAFTQRVLQQALRRLQAPADDPAWALAAVEAGAAAQAIALEALAPASWSDPLLAGSPALTQALHAAPSADAQATVWLTAARRWLRRAGRIGLASLVLRPGFMGLTPTHADVHFRLHHTDLRVRRLGLDIDPGWLPWYGRVVAFHYRRNVPW